MKKYIFAISLCLFSSASFAQACAQTGNNLTGLVGLGTQADSNDERIFAQLQNSDGQCGCNVARFVNENVNTKAVLGVLLTAKATSSTVRIDFLDRDNCDTAYRAFVE